MLADDFNYHGNKAVLRDGTDRLLTEAQQEHEEQLEILREKFLEVLQSDDYWSSTHDDRMEWSSEKTTFHDTVFSITKKGKDIVVNAFGFCIFTPEKDDPAFHLNDTQESRIRDMFQRLSQYRTAMSVARDTADLKNKFEKIF